MSLSPQKQYAIRRWFWITFFLSMIAILASAYFIVPELLMYITLKKEITVLREQTKPYGEHSKQKDTLKTAYEQSRAQSSKVDQYVNTPKNPHAYIATIVQACGDGVTLESINLHKKSCDITVLSPTAEHSTVFIKRLSASELFTAVKLVSLQQDIQTKQMRCVIKSSI